MSKEKTQILQSENKKINDQQKIVQLSGLADLNLLFGQGNLLQIVDRKEKVIFECTNKSCKYRLYATTVLEHFLKVLDEIPITKSEYIKFFKLFTRLFWYPNKKPRNLSDHEKQVIADHRKDFSIRQIAEILDRSTSTIHEAIKKV